MFKRIIKTSFFSVSSRGLLTLTNLIILFSISRVLGAKVLGIYSITAFFYYLFSFLTSFELTTYLGKEVAHKRDNVRDTQKLFGEVVTTFLIGACASVLVLLCLLIFYKEIDASLLIISAVAGLVFGVEKNLSGILLGKEKMQYEFISQVVAFILVAVPVFFLVRDLDVAGIYFLRIGASIVCIGLRGQFTRALTYLEKRHISLKNYNWKEIKFFSASGFAFFIQHHIDFFILSFMISKELLGAYFLALRIFLSFNLLAEMLSFALTPFISRSFRGKDSNSFDRFYSHMLKIQLAMGVAASVFLFFSRDYLVSFFSGEADPQLASDFLFYFSFLAFFRFVSYYTGNVLTSTKYQDIRFYILITAAVLMILMEIVLGRLFSVHGVICSRAVMEILIFVGYLAAVTKVRTIPLKAEPQPETVSGGEV